MNKIRSILHIVALVAVALVLPACSSTPGAAPTTATTKAATPTAPVSNTAQAQANFQAFLARVNAANAQAASDLSSPQGQQFLADAAAAAFSGAIAASSEGANIPADTAAFAAVTKQLGEFAALPGVQKSTPAQLKSALANVSAGSATAQKLTPQIVSVYGAATAKGANSMSVITALQQGVTQAQAQSATAAVNMTKTAGAVPQ